MCALKEPSYFAYEDGAAHHQLPWPDPYVRELPEYAQLFDGAETNRIRAESSTLYFQNPEAARRIQSVLPDVKIVAILRDPADRAFSHFVHHRLTDSEPIANFRSALDAWSTRSAAGWRPNWDYIGPGFYAKHLAAYRSLFGDDHVRIFFI